MKVEVSGMVWLSMEELGADGVAYLKKALTIVPKKLSMYSDTKPTPIRCYRIEKSRGCIGVPRAYFFGTSQGNHEIVWTFSDGEPMAPFKNLLRQEGKYAEQATAIDAMWDHMVVPEGANDNRRGLGLGGILQGATGFGKTNTALALAYKLGRKTLIIVHKEFLMRQWVRRIKRFMPDARVGIVQEARCEFEDHDFSVAMVQSLSLEGKSGEARYPQEFYSHHGLIFIDETHRIGAGSWAPVPSLFAAQYIVGLTATPRRKDGADKVFWWSIGEVVYKAKTETPKPLVRMVESDARGPDMLTEDTVSPSVVINVLTKLTKRNQVVVDEAVKALRSPAGRKLMVISERLEQLKVLEKLIREQSTVEDLSTGFYVGEWFTGEMTLSLKKVRDLEPEERLQAIATIYRHFRRYKAAGDGLKGVQAEDDITKAKSKKKPKVTLMWNGKCGRMTVLYAQDENGDDRFDPAHEISLYKHRHAKRILENLNGKQLCSLARDYDIAQDKSKPVRKPLTEEDLYEAERARVVFATYQMCCVDIDTEVVDPLNGEVVTMRQCIEDGAKVRVVSGRNVCSVVEPSDVGLFGIKECVEVVVGGTGKRSLVLTPDHRMWTQRGWVEAGDLVAHEGSPSSTGGDYVSVPRKLDLETQPTDLSEDDAWLMGLLMADGSLSCPERGTFGLTSDDQELVSEADRVLRSHGMFLAKERHQHWNTRVLGGSSGPGRKSWLREELERLGMCKTAHNKRLPQELVMAPLGIVRSYLGGYVDGDGCVSAEGRFSFSSVSRPLLEQTRTLLLRLGIPTKPPFHGGKGCWVVLLGRHESQVARELVGMRLARKKLRVGSHDKRRLGVGDFTMVPPQMARDLVQRGRDGGFMVKAMAEAAEVFPSKLSAKIVFLSRERYDAIAEFIGEPVLSEAVAWIPVRAVVAVGAREVGDFAVPPDKSWAASGIIVHNSEGVDIPAIDTQVLASPVSDVEQAAGRARRFCVPVAFGGDKTPEDCEHLCSWRAGTCEGKPTPIVADIVDRRFPLTQRRKKYRLSFYRELGTKVAGATG